MSPLRAWLSFKDPALPQNVEYFHSLVPLDNTTQRNAVLFGHPSWVYKVQSSQDGRYYTLRRLEGSIPCKLIWSMQLTVR